MNYKLSAIVLLLYLFTVSCSATPGDAANRGGHPEQAADLYKQGAEQGDSGAALKLGLMVTKGNVSASKYGKGIYWYMRACELGSNAGCHNSGNAYEYGQSGATKSYDKAQKYYAIAAERGYMQSQYNLGSLYSNQYINNDIEGLKWMLIAEKTANNCPKVPLCQWVKKDPPGHQANLMGRMSKNHITESQQQANEWKVK